MAEEQVTLLSFRERFFYLLARSAVVPTSPCRNHLHPPSVTRVGQGWLVRSSGSVNAFRIVFEKSALFFPVHLLIFVTEQGKMGRESAHTVSLSQLSFPTGQNGQSVEQLH